MTKRTPARDFPSQSDVRLFLGKSSSGKSTLALFQVKRFKRVIWYDPNGERDGKDLPGAVLCSDPRMLLDLARAPGPMRIIWRGVVAGGEDAFEWANRVAWAAEDFVLVWDECDRYMNAGKAPPAALQIIDAGRHRKLRVFACARRPYRVNRSLSGVAWRIMSAMTTEPRDIRYLGDVIGSAADRLSTLAPYTFLDWQEGREGAEVKKSPFA